MLLSLLAVMPAPSKAMTGHKTLFFPALFFYVMVGRFLLTSINGDYDV